MFDFPKTGVNVAGFCKISKKLKKADYVNYSTQVSFSLDLLPSAVKQVTELNRVKRGLLSL